MRVVMAMMKHATNTFSSVPTRLARFASGEAEPYRGRGGCGLQRHQFGAGRLQPAPLLAEKPFSVFSML